VDPSSVTNLHKITERIGCVMTGPLPDTLSAVRRAREFAADFQFEHGYAIPVHFLAKKMADENQIFTQAAYKRSLASVMILGWCVVCCCCARGVLARGGPGSPPPSLLPA
jgi:20S proteasome subunit alpha 1